MQWCPSGRRVMFAGYGAASPLMTPVCRREELSLSWHREIWMWLACSCESQTPQPMMEKSLFLVCFFLICRIYYIYSIQFLLFYLFIYFIPSERWGRTVECLEKRRERKLKLKCCLAVMLSPLCCRVFLRAKTEQEVVDEETYRELTFSEAFQI